MFLQENVKHVIMLMIVMKLERNVIWVLENVKIVLRTNTVLLDYVIVVRNVNHVQL